MTILACVWPTRLILNAYLTARREAPQDLVEKLRQMAAFAPDKWVRRAARRALQEPWAQGDETG